MYRSGVSMMATLPPEGGRLASHGRLMAGYRAMLPSASTVTPPLIDDDVSSPTAPVQESAASDPVSTSKPQSAHVTEPCAAREPGKQDRNSLLRTVEARYPVITCFARSDISFAIEEFHTAFGLPRRTTPEAKIDPTLAALRIALLQEEVEEFVEASHTQDIVKIADALADITCVVYGTALTYGIDLDSVLEEVHRSNMSKLDPAGKPIVRADGKVLKSSMYSPPDISRVLGRR